MLLSGIFKPCLIASLPYVFSYFQGRAGSSGYARLYSHLGLPSGSPSVHGNKMYVRAQNMLGLQPTSPKFIPKLKPVIFPSLTIFCSFARYASWENIVQSYQGRSFAVRNKQQVSPPPPFFG